MRRDIEIKYFSVCFEGMKVAPYPCVQKIRRKPFREKRGKVVKINAK
jgi:hypothetical protein